MLEATIKYAHYCTQLQNGQEGLFENNKKALKYIWVKHSAMKYVKLQYMAVFRNTHST